MKGRIVLVVIGLLFTAGLVVAAAVAGMPPLFVIAWLVLVIAIGVITRQTLFSEDTAWPPPAPEPPFRGSEVSRLAWAVNTRSGIVGLGLVRRLDRAVRHRAAAHGLDPEDPAHVAEIEALFGPGIRTALEARVVRRDDVERILAALESVPPTLERR
ncbi:hypothetical protein [Microbacterium tumbae]